MKDKIEVYTNSNCPYCKTIKEELNKNKIKFEEKTTLENKDDWQKVIQLTGIPTVPTIYYKDNYFVPGRDFFNPMGLIQMINNFEPSTFSVEIQCLEKLKTLNSNINTAFSRLDQLLRQIETKINTDEHKN
tara:strand:- start:195 stop:587 length:393 start_codon:yes stop_codon:yes gene_type:complete